jgi:hypothetical protein
MTTSPRLLLCAAALVLAAPAMSRGQSSFVDAELGYRFVHVSGNEDMYRSQFNEREGLVLSRFSLFAQDPLGGMADRIRIESAGLGAGPAGMLRLEAGKGSAYTLRVRYDRMELFSALPGFANPLLPDGIVPGEHTYDRVRHLLDLNLELMPGRAITPLVGFTYNRLSGPGRTTYDVGGDEFRLREDRTDVESEIRVGAAFHAGAFAGEVTQGWRKNRESADSSLVPGAGAGNNPGTVLGVPVELSDLVRHGTSTTNTPVTRAFVRGDLLPRLRVIGAYTRASVSGDASERENLSGNLVSFELSRFFGGLAETESTQAKNRTWQANGRVELDVAPGIDLTAGYQHRRRELDGFALISELFLDTVNFSGSDPRDLARLIEARTSIDRTDDVFDVDVAARPIDPLTLKANWSHTNEDLTVREDPSEIVVPGSQEGSFSRKIRSIGGGATFSQAGITLGGDVKVDRADDAILRIDFRDRTRLRARAGWHGLNWLNLLLTAQQVDSSNRQDGIGYSGRSRLFGGELEVTPIAPLHLRVGASTDQADSKIFIREPQDFSIDRSLHSENGKSIEAGATLDLSRVTFDADYARLKNSGTFPFTLERLHGRFGWGFSSSLWAYAEWGRDNYRESLASLANLGNYDANRYIFSVRWRQ